MKHVYRVFVLLLLLSGIALTAFAQTSTPTPAAETEMTAEEQENRAVVEAYFEAQNSGDLETAFAFLSPDIAGWNAFEETEPQTFEATQDFFLGLQQAVPDLEVTILDMIVEGDKVVVRFSLTGTLSVEMMGMPAGSEFVQGIIAIYRLEAGQIVEVWSY